MPRYISRRERHWIIDDGYWSGPNSPIINMQTPEHTPTDTGLLDADGNRILKHPRSIGFHADMD